MNYKGVQMRKLSLLMVLMCVACDKTVSPPPPPAGIATVQLVADSGTIFMGKALPGARLVAHVLDSAGYEVPDVVLSLTASPGWTIHGDTVIAPLTEGRGSVQVTAKRRVSVAASAPINAPAVAMDSVTSDAVSLGTVVNLDSLQLTATSFTCRVGSQTVVTNDSVGIVDSLQYVTPVVDSVLYESDSPTGGYLIGAYGWAGQFWLSADLVVYGHTSSAHYVGQRWFVPMTKQIPDTLTLGLTGNGLPGKVTAIREGSPASYTTSALPFCQTFVRGMTADSITFTATH